MIVLLNIKDNSMRSKILILILFAVLLSSCKYFRGKPKEPVDDFLKVPTYVDETPIGKVERDVVPQRENNSNVSYWYVVAIASNNGGTVTYSGFVKQDHSYFSLGEVKAAYREKVLITNFIQVSKETYEKNN
jgi:hypothetical protein